ncbi:sulfite exporter TauE/SafE family protein [Sphingomonas yabuuchiae]
MPTLIALGLPSTIANATSNVALQPAAMASVWAYRHGLEPVMGVSMRRMAALTFVFALLGSILLFLTPPRAFDLIVPWLLLTATIAIAGTACLGMAGADRPAGPRALMGAQAVLGVYGGYFGGGIGMMVTAAWGLLSGRNPAQLAAPRTLMLATANAAATLVFVATGMVAWAQCLPMLAGGIVGGWSGALIGRRLPAGLIRGWTLLLTTVTTAVFFYRGYA